MPQDSVTTGNLGSQDADISKLIEPSILNALPHYLPLGVFPLIFAAAAYGGWWLLLPFLFFSTAGGSIDRALGLDGRNMDPARTPERRLLWHSLPVWLWAFLWLPTLIFGIWQILVANPFAIWEDVILALILTMEAQAVFIVGHELIHRRSTWERRLGEFLLASASYPQYATEHVYIHHAQVGTPHDVGSAPKGESFWQYFPKEVASNLINSWQIAAERLARRRLPVWHYSNPFWRYVIAIAFWYGLVFWMGGIWAVLVFAFLGYGCVFSMKISNYLQHYGLRRVRLPNGRWEKVMPRHSWNADWKFSNWMFFNMQRHPDHHAMAGRHYPLLQNRGADESPQLPGTYGDLMNLVVRPKRWFEKMDPLVDHWRAHFYPEIDDWSAYDSRVSAARPAAFDAIVEIFGAAPRLAKWIERNPELLDNLQDREFTDLDLPKGFGPDPESESIARRGLTRLYWTREMGIAEMKELIAEIPATDAKDTVEVVRNWSNDKAFQIGMHTLRGNLSPAEARVALANLAEASISTVLSAAVEDFSDRRGPRVDGGLAAILLGDLASRDVAPGVDIEILFTYDGWPAGENENLCKRFRKALAGLSRDSLVFAPMPRGSKACLALPLCDFAEHCRAAAPSGELPDLVRARCVFEAGDSGIGQRFEKARRQILAEDGVRDALIADLRKTPEDAPEPGLSSFSDMRGGLHDVERAARFLVLTQTETAQDEPPVGAAAVLSSAGADSLSEAAAVWRDLQGILQLVGGEGFEAEKAGPKVRDFIAGACGADDFNALKAAVAELASRAGVEIDALVARA